MKKIWLGIGAVVIVILLLLQTKFNIFMRVEDGGYAVDGSSVKHMLMSDPEEEQDIVEVPYYRFEALDYIYQRGNSFYMGENKKTQVDLAFPFYIKDSAGIMFTGNSGTLFDLQFDEAEVYQGLRSSERIAYNPGGERADATEYLFYGMQSGLFINLDTISYEDRGEERQIAMNSIIYFCEDYFTYCEPDGDKGIYQICKTIQADDIVTINGAEETYRDLLIKLHVISEKRNKLSNKPEEPDLEIPNQEYPAGGPVDAPEKDEADKLSGEETEKEKKEEKEEKEESVEKKEKEAKDKTEASGASASRPAQQPQQSSGTPAKPSRPQTGSGSGSGSNQQGSMGVRPDYMRPDKRPTGEGDPPVVGYKKPVVEVTDIQEGVYRLTLTLKVDDRARRLHPLKRIQLEFYEIGKDGKETLAYRSYAGYSSKVEAGNGGIKPDTKYRVNCFFTYYDEYDQVVVESVLNTTLQTKAMDTLSPITLADRQIDIFYDNRLELPGVVYEKENSDEEAVYGIRRAGGLLLTVEGKGTQLGFHTETIVESNDIRNFKSGLEVILKSMPNLKPNSSYSYKLEAIDYFGNKLQVLNNTGNFQTCKSRPAGSLEMVKNKIGETQIQVNLNDSEDAAVPGDNAGNYNIYLVFSSEKNTELTPVTRQECDAVLAAGGWATGGKIDHVYKFSETEYKKYLGGDGAFEINIDKVIEADKLELNKKYYTYLFCDYNLNNGRGTVEFGEVASLSFTSASLSSLGDIYVTVDISNVTAHSAVIAYTLNKERTNDVLESLLSDVKFEIIRGKGEEKVTDSFIQFDTEAMKVFTGYDHATEPPSAVPGGAVLMDASFYLGEEEGKNPLKSMTNYTIGSEVWATYNGIKYPMNAVLTTSDFKTIREPAKVEVTNLLLAAGNLFFDVQVKDTDQAITGNSGHMVVMNLYQQDGTFVKAIRIPKNTEEPYPVVIKKLNPDASFKLTFIAVEYNEGFTNSTFESNKILLEMLLSDSVDLKGDIKLKNVIGTAADRTKLLANTTVTLQDKDKLLQNLPYFIQVEKNGVDVTASGGYPTSYTVAANEYDANKTVKQSRQFQIDKGENTYRLTLYVYVNSQKLELDTLTFTSEETVESIANAEEFIWKIKKNNGEGKYVVTADIAMESDIQYADPDPADPANPPAPVTPIQIVNTFNGKIDFQGYTLSYNYKSAASHLFANTGPDSELSNLVLEVKTENYNASIYNSGVISRYNYGWLHDITIRYKGGAAMSNRYFGLVCRGNSVSGVIENFVIGNEPEEGLMPFTARYECGLVCGLNKGIIRNGYVYGDDIYSNIGTPSQGGTIRVAGIAGAQGSTGRIQNVYSLVNVLVANPSESSSGTSPVTDYGSVAGNAGGRLDNMYGIGQSFYESVYNGNFYDSARGPVAGSNNSKSSRVYYWNENNRDYAKSLYQERIGLESLHDYSWQGSLLGDQFITSNVEVGFYPHVVQSEEMPEQPYIPLPNRASENLVEIMSATVIEYTDNEQAAIVEFRFSNNKNADIRAITIDNLTTVIDYDTISSADGYTTLRAKVSDPVKFFSAYEITGVECYINGRTQRMTFSPNPLLLVDFYRNIYTAQDWYDYVVCAPTENARLQADIDFAGSAENEILVASDYKGKLDGNAYRGGTSDSPEGYTISNFTMKNTPNLFRRVYGSIKNLCVENAVLGTSGKILGHVGLVREHYGILDNVHMKNMTLTGYGYMGSAAALSYAVSEVKNSSATGVSITYLEPANTNTNGRIGGLVGHGAEVRINNCYVRDLDMAAEDIKNCDGAGGIVGYGYYCVVDSVYATGNMTVRGMNVGGIIGYYTAGEIDNSIVNILSRVNVFSYQDKIGGIIGESSLGAILNDRNNVSGVALGNIFSNNPNSDSVSFTVGNFTGSPVSFYGSEVQLLNGMSGQPKDANTLELLSSTEIMNPATYTEKVHMSNCYDYSKAADGFFPVLYYEGTSTPLPFQTDIPLSTVTVQNNEIEVENAGCNEAQRYVFMDLINPQEYDITGVTIENLKYTFDMGNSGKLRIFADYLPAMQQEHWQDSYLLTEIFYQKMGDDGQMIVGKADYSKNPVRIPLTLFCDIRNCDDWNHYINAANNYGNYENYRVVADISFTGVVPTTNAKLGRLRGEVNNGNATLSNINIGPGYGTLKGNKENLIFRLNSELSNISFKNCTVNSAQRDCIGLIGTSAAQIKNVDFENITVNNRSAGYHYIGMIGNQIGGSLEDITLKNVQVGTNGTNQNYSGGLVGYSLGNTLYKNITGEQVAVKGNYYVGGVLGRTERARFDTIAYKDIKVTGLGGDYVGGIVGYNSSPRTSTNAPCLWNITIEGTPSYDAEGNITDSTTVIGVQENMLSGTSGNYVAGVAGYMLGYYNGWENSLTNAKPILIDGIVVKGYGSYIGGGFGRAYDASNVTVKNSLITNNKLPSAQYSYVGGISGYQDYGNTNNLVENTVIDVKNHSMAGILVGRKPNNGSITYCNVNNSVIKVQRTLSGGTHSEIGGLIGRSEAGVYYSGVLNSSVITDSTLTGYGYDNVGGVVGYATNSVNRCFYYAKPESSTSPAAKPEYQVTGNCNTGGVIGWQNSGGAVLCYSNANVRSKDHSAGGISGVYQNAYSVSRVSGKDVYGYSGVSMYYNYFAGTVHAGKWAGGAIGRNNMSYSADVAQAHKTNGGRSTSTAETGYKSGSSYESYYTYQNLIMAKQVTADTAGTAHAFSGSQDGFEGKANGVNVAKDKTTLDKARRTYFWTGMMVGGTTDDDRLYYAKNQDAPACAKNSGDFRFKLWNKKEYIAMPTELANTTNYNVRLVSTEDLKDLRMYISLGLLTWTSGQGGHQTEWKESNGTYNGDNMKGTYHRFITSGIVSDTLWNAVGDADFYKGKDYLPHLRVNTSNNAISDQLVRTQSKYQVALPVPVWNSLPRETITALSRRFQRNTYAIIYPVDADKVNVEFSQDLVDNGGYFILSYGNEKVDKQLITKRVYTYTYDYQAGLKLQYGTADAIGFTEDMEAAGKVNGIDFMLDDIFDYSEEYCQEAEEPVYYKAAALARHVMTHGMEYYYIDEDGIVHGTGSSAEGEESAQTLPGSYITLYNGKALTKDGQIIDVGSGEAIGSVEGINVLDNPQPLQSFDYDGFRIETYSRFAEAVDTEIVARESQVLKGSTGVVGFVDGMLENVKDSILLYMKDEKTYQTILGVDGIMVDMCQGEDINAPEDFKNSGIVYMTNNLNCSAPFVLVEYANGGIVGYNYMTGEYLFDHSITNAMNLLDYAKVYFTGDKSMYAQMSNTYAANKKVADIAGTPERLFTMVEGNSSGEMMEKNNSGEGTESEHEKSALAEEGAKTEGETAMSEGGVEDLANEDGQEQPLQGEGKGDNQLLNAEEAIGGSSEDGSAEGADTDTAGLAGESEGGNTLDNGLAAEIGALTPAAPADAERIIGEGKGNGMLVASGQAMGNGENAGTDGSIGEVLAPVGEKDITEEAADAGSADNDDGQEDASETDALEEAASETQNSETDASEKELSASESDDIQETKEEEIRTSTAGTPVEKAERGIDNGKKAPQHGSLDKEEKPEMETGNMETNRNTETGKLVTVYNQSTGTYEIVDMRQYFSTSGYQSENVKLAVRDMSAYAGYAQQKEEKKHADGLALYILVAAAALAGVGFTMKYRKNHKMK